MAEPGKDCPDEGPVRRGQAWGEPVDRAPDLVVGGGDAELARAAEDHPGALIRWSPATGDLGRALGLGFSPSDRASPAQGLALAIDGLWWRAQEGALPLLAVNAIVLGPAPDNLRSWHRRVPIQLRVDGRERFAGRATTVAIVNGQWVRRAEVSPRGHPGDGRVEVQVYALPRSDRRAMRSRLATGSHLDHPRIATWPGRAVLVVAGGGGLRLEADGREVSRGIHRLEVTVKPALRLLV